MHKALLLGVVQLALIASLGGKLLADRATRPRFWLKTNSVDPDLPVRGRYVRLQVEVPAPALGASRSVPDRVLLEAGPQGLTAVLENGQSGEGLWARVPSRFDHPVVTLEEPVAYFIPEHVADPSSRAAGEELWVEVTVPKKGPPRPIRLGVKRGGVITPLQL